MRSPLLPVAGLVICACASAAPGGCDVPRQGGHSGPAARSPQSGTAQGTGRQPPAIPGRPFKEPSGRGRVPRPGGTTPEDAIANFRAGLEQWRLSSDSFWGPLYEDVGRWQRFQLVRALRVKSLIWSHPDYWVLVFHTIGGQRYGVVTVSAEGWLYELSNRSMSAGLEPPQADAVEGVIGLAGIKKPGTTWRWVYAPSQTLGGDPTEPLAEVTDGTWLYYVAPNGRVYERAVGSTTPDASIITTEGTVGLRHVYE